MERNQADRCIEIATLLAYHTLGVTHYLIFEEDPFLAPFYIGGFRWPLLTKLMF
jgi:hypothetical protein